MQVEFTKKFIKSFNKIKDKSTQKNISKTIVFVEHCTNINEIPKLKKLKGYSTYYRIRLGDYRLGLKIQKNVVYFADVAHRKDIYNKFP